MKNSLIDTIKFTIKVEHGYLIDKHKRLKAEGVSNRLTNALTGSSHKFKVPGIYGTTATVWSKKSGQLLQIECSAAKFLTGHNVFGSENLNRIILDISKRVCRYLKIKPTAKEKQAIKAGDVRLFRVDLAAHFRLPSKFTVRSFQNALKMQLAFTQRSFATYADETLYVNQHSDMRPIKIYDKGEEILFHRLPQDLPDKEAIERYTQNLVRVEMTFRSRFLRIIKMSQVKEWDKEKARNLFKEDLLKLNLLDSSLLQGEPISGLTNLQNSIIALHAAGVDISTVIQNARQLKIHIKAIREKAGIDVRIPSTALSLSMVPVKCYLEGLNFGKKSD